MLAFGLILDGVEAKGEEKAKGEEPAVILRDVRGVPPKGEDGVLDVGRVYLTVLLVLLMLLVRLLERGVDVLDWSDMDETDPRDEVELLLSRVGDGGKYSCFCGP